MTNNGDKVKGVALLQNGIRLSALVERTTSRSANLTGMGGFYGKSGVGKSLAAAKVVGMYPCCYIQIQSSWTRKHIALSILREMSITIPSKSTLPELIELIAEELVASNKVLLIDEADFLLTSDAKIELIRDIYEITQGSVIFIGEENFPAKLKRRWERVYNRVLEWVKAEGCNLTDCKQLAAIYAPNVAISDALLNKLNNAVLGCTRRVCVNLDDMKNFAATNGLTELTEATYTPKIDTGSPLRG